MYFPYAPVLSTLSLLVSLSHAHGSNADSEEPQAASQPYSIEILTPEFFPQYHSQRLKLTYGPYTVPSMHQDNGMISFGGLVTPPCTDCLM
jgi:hypothetical protein